MTQTTVGSPRHTAPTLAYPSTRGSTSSDDGRAALHPGNDRSAAAASRATSTDLPYVTRGLIWLFGKCGLWVADHDYLVLIVVLAFSLITSAIIPFTPQDDDIKNGYTPRAARAHHEIATFNEFFGATGEPIQVFLFVTAKDGGSMVRAREMNATMDALEIASQELRFKGLAYSDIASDFSLINEPLIQLHNGLQLREDQTETNATEGGLADSVTVAYPVMSVLGREFDLSPHLFGVINAAPSSAENHTSALSSTTSQPIQFAKVALIHLRANSPAEWSRLDVHAFERVFSDFFHKNYHSDLIDVHVMSLTLMSDEIIRTGMTIFPFLGVGFTVMALFSIVTVWMSSRRMNQAYLAVGGCVCPLLATSSALGLLFWFGFRFGTILYVTPFLVLAIGVDDAYMQIHSWDRLRAQQTAARLERMRRGEPFNEQKSGRRELVAAMLQDVGPSISITSFTNFVAFMTGLSSPTAEIRLFVAANAVCILFDYIYQITLFTALLSICGKYEIEHTKELPLKTKSNRRAWIDAYADWLSSGFTFALVLAGLLFYWVGCTSLTLSMHVGLSIEKLLLPESPLNTVNALRDQYMLPNYTVAMLFVGDLTIPDRHRRVSQLIETYESYPEALPPKFSHFWLREYDKYLAFLDQDAGEMSEDESTTKSPEETALAQRSIYAKTAMTPFLDWPEFQHWRGFIRFSEGGNISSFFTTVAFHGADMGLFTKRTEMLHRWRATADQFPDLNVTVFDDNSPFVDQISVIVPSTWQTAVATLCCMSLVCFFFMQNIFTVVVASLSIVSICIGVFGFLAMWSVDLDPMTMAITIMSIGFSVDFPAHITYHYFRSGIEFATEMATTEGSKYHSRWPARRIAHSLEAIGFPLLQCGISTLLFVLCLLFVDVYMANVFVKTMVLVVTLGLIHGLLIVPTFLCFLSHTHYFLRRKFSGAASDGRNDSSVISKFFMSSTRLNSNGSGSSFTASELKGAAGGTVFSTVPDLQLSDIGKMGASTISSKHGSLILAIKNQQLGDSNSASPTGASLASFPSRTPHSDELTVENASIIRVEQYDGKPETTQGDVTASPSPSSS